MSTPPDSLIIGQVAAPFGIKGEIKINILTEFPDRFNKLDAVILAPTDEDLGSQGSVEDRRTTTETQNAKRETPSTELGTRNPELNPQSATQNPKFTRPKGPAIFTIESVRSHKGQALVKLGGVDDATTADLLRNFFVLVPIEEAHRLPRGSYYLYQIVGLEVYTTGGDLLGTIAEVLSTAANDVYIVRGPGVEDPTGELLVPAIKEIVKKMDVPNGRITIRPPSEWA